jgi:signal transduction histidine kinase
MLDRLEESFARERRFIADASHELRTPLAVMETILDVTTSEPRTATEYREALADLTDETGRLRALAENLLVSARQTQTPPAKLAPVDISLLAEDIGDALRPLAEAKSLQLRVTSEPGLMVMADSDTLVRALLNLVDNAIKYTERGGIDIRVSSKKDRVVLDVSDTGIGIPQNRQTDIFDRFCQLDSSRRSPGAGLGLSIASQIVQNHGGTLRVRSSPGRGSTFTVALDRLPKSR